MDEDVTEVRAFISFSIVEEEPNNPFSRGLSYSTYDTREIAISPDGKWIAFGWWNEPIQVCELVEGGRNLTYRGHKNRVFAIEWAPNGKWIASASGEEKMTGDVQVWEPTTGRLVSLIQCDEGERVMSLAWSPNSAHLAFGTMDGIVYLVNPLTGERELIHKGQCRAGGYSAVVAWSPDGTRIASSGKDGAVEVWYASDGTSICRYLGHFGCVNAVAWSPDGTSIASGSDDQTVHVWNASTREPIFTYKHHSSRVMTVGWLRTGQRVRSASWDGTIQEWDAYDGAHSTLFPFPLFPNANAKSFAWNFDATTFAMGLEDRRVAVADMREGKLLICRAPAMPVEQIGQANTEQRTGGSRHREGRPMKVWGGTQKEVVVYRGHTNAVRAVAWSPDDRFIASGGHDNTVQIWDAANGKLHFTCRGHLDPVTTVAWSPDGQSLVSGSLDTTARIWDANTGCSITDYRGHSATIWSLAWAPPSPSSAFPSNATRIASGSEDGTIQVWDMEKHISLTYRGHHGSVEAVAWSPDGRFIASSGEDKTVQVWDAITGEVICTYTGHVGGALSVAWSPDGKRIASGGSWEGGVAENPWETPKLHLWEALTGSNPIFCDDGLTHGYIPVVAWSPDGRFVAAGDDGFGHIRVYDAATGKSIAEMSPRVHGRYQQSGRVLSLAWSSDGQRIAASFSGGLIYIWPTH
jgi:WD40 repeat protein